MNHYQDEIPTYRRLDDPTRPLWGMSIRTLLTLGAAFVAGWLFIKSGVMPTKWAITVATMVLAGPVVLAAITDGNTINPAREVFAVLAALSRSNKPVVLDATAISGGVVVSDIPLLQPDTDPEDGHALAWSESLPGAEIVEGEQA